MSRKAIALAASLAASVSMVEGTTAVAQEASGNLDERVWINPSLDPDRRAAALLDKMTADEKALLVFGYFGTGNPDGSYTPPAGAREGSAGFVPGIPRLGIPAQWQTDAGIGVATQPTAKIKLERTALPSNIAAAATWSPELAFDAGAMIGREARLSGFNVMLAGGVNLVREPRSGRNFEYGGEDPLLAGVIVGAQIAGVQSNHIVSTIKHFAFNDQETGRQHHDVLLEHGAARMSDLLAFQFAIEASDPGSVMCAYNRVDGAYACENKWLLTDVLRRDWGWKGYVMSDWGATHSTVQAVDAGLDQETGWPFDKQPFYRELLRKAIDDGRVPAAKLDLMATRILRTMFAKGLFEYPVTEGPIDLAAHAEVSRKAAEAGAVLLTNRRNLLPLSTTTRRIVVIGGYADRGVLSGGGSSQTYPVGGNAVTGLGPKAWPGPIVYYPSSPVAAMRALAPGASISFVSGDNLAEAAAAAAAADVAVVFATKWNAESIDSPLALPDGQDRLISAVARVNRNTAVVLETGGAVTMPWAKDVAAILQAWYPGTSGGEAIANLLFGAANPSGKLPITFPLGANQLPRPKIPGAKLPEGTRYELKLAEGAAVGYKWYDRNGLVPLFPFGHGLSYSQFALGELKAVRSSEGGIVARFRVSNTGQRSGAEVAQVYVQPVRAGWESPKRLGGFARVELAPGEGRDVDLTVDPRLLAVFDVTANRWRIAAGQYRILLSRSSRDVVEVATVTLPATIMPAGWRPASAAVPAVKE